MCWGCGVEAEEKRLPFIKMMMHRAVVILCRYRDEVVSESRVASQDAVRLVLYRLYILGDDETLLCYG